MTVTVVHASRPVINTSMPSRRRGCPGTSKREETIKTATKSRRAAKARLGSRGVDKILLKLMDTPTNVNPLKVAAAPNWAEKKPCHWSINFYPQGFDNIDSGQDRNVGGTLPCGEISANLIYINKVC